MSNFIILILLVDKLDKGTPTEKDNYNDIVRFLEPNSSANKIHEIRLYYVRMHDTKTELKVQLDLGKHIKFTFNEGKHLCGKDNFGPILYTLDLLLIKDDNGQLYVDHQIYIHMILDK